MFAGEGDAFRTNRRFHLLSEDMPAKRLSTAFDSVTLYGYDPDERPDIYGKVGNSGVSIATLDDMKVLYSGLRSVRPRDLGVDDDQRPGADDPGDVHEHRDRPAAREVSTADNGREPDRRRSRRRSRAWTLAERARHGAGRHPEGRPGPEHLHLLHRVLAEGDGRHRRVLRRTTTCATSTRCRSRGYHIAEAGANPICQLAFTLANGFTFVEAYLARGMHIDDFAPNLSFFFSNGMDPEYTVLGRVARRIWAVAMRDRYGANERSQKLKYHVQTSGRSLHAQEIAVQRHPHHAAGADRDLRQLQLAAHQRLRRGDHHADRGSRAPRDGDPADHQPRVGPGEEREPQPGRVRHRRADRAGRGGGAEGVRGASPSAAACSARWRPATSAARSRRSRCTTRCSSTTASYPIVGVNTFRNPHGDPVPQTSSSWRARPTRRSARQLKRLRDFQARHAKQAPAMLQRLQQAVIENEQRVRGADGRGAGLLAGADHARAVRGRRAVPPQHVVFHPLLAEAGDGLTSAGVWSRPRRPRASVPSSTTP